MTCEKTIVNDARNPRINAAIRIMAINEAAASSPSVAVG